MLLDHYLRSPWVQLLYPDASGSLSLIPLGTFMLPWYFCAITPGPLGHSYVMLMLLYYYPLGLLCYPDVSVPLSHPLGHSYVTLMLLCYYLSSPWAQLCYLDASVPLSHHIGHSYVINPNMPVQLCLIIYLRYIFFILIFLYHYISLCRVQLLYPDASVPWLSLIPWGTAVLSWCFSILTTHSC